MRDIRAQISQRHGIELSNQQIQELAARRLEAILDPRTVKPALLDQLRRSAGSPADVAPHDPQPAYTFEGGTLYDSHNGLLRSIRRLLNPVLRLFFNPNPIVLALNAQAKLNTEAARREAERDRRQAEWNALHFSIVQRLVTEVSRASIETQSLSMRVESLAAKVDFNERRVRGLENTAHQSAPAPRVAEVGAVTVASPATPATDTTVSEVQSEGARRRRRRRRGRRGTGMGPMEAMGTSTTSTGSAALEGPESADDEHQEEIHEPPVSGEPVSSEPVSAEPAPIETRSNEPVSQFEPLETTPIVQPAELSAVREPTPAPAPDEPFRPAAVDPPDPGPADR